MVNLKGHIGSCTGVSLILLKDGLAEWNICAVKREGSRLTLGKKVTGSIEIRELLAELSPGSVIALNLSGKTVLHKQTENESPEFNKLLPGYREEDFYVQTCCSDTLTFVSFIRKREADQWIALLKNAGHDVVQVSLGPFPVTGVTEQLNVYDSELIFDGHIISLGKNRSWLSYYYNKETRVRFRMKVDMEELEESLLIPYAAAFQTVLSDKMEAVRAGVVAADQRFAELLTDKRIKKAAIVILCIFFVLLFFNTLVFSWLYNANEKLTVEVSRSMQNTEGLQKLQQQVRYKEKFVKELGWEGQINKSRLIDQIAALLPVEITWVKLSVNPVDLNASRRDRSVRFDSRTIVINGKCLGVVPVNEWVARLKTIKWIKNAQLDDFTFSTEQNTGLFTVVIYY